jgi:Outer membrane receptor proteins, mostly Fe transport
MRAQPLTLRLAASVTLSVLALATSAKAQTHEVPSSATHAAPRALQATQTGVLVFNLDFFAEYRPTTALDMVERIPGFSVDNGSGSRGFEGAVGNVLINGSRPASKSDTGANALSRITADQVERIDLVRGGAAGIDMQGYAVVVNVITKRQASQQTIATYNAFLYGDGGTNLFGAALQHRRQTGDRTWGVTLGDGVSSSDSNGAGTNVRTDAAGAVIRQEDFANDSYGGSQSVRVNFADAFQGGKIDLTGRLGRNDYHSLSDLSSATTARENRFENKGNGGEFGVVFTRPLRERLNLESRFIHQFSDYESQSTSRNEVGGVVAPEQLFDSSGASSETIVRNLVRWQQTERVNWEVGGEVAYNRLQTDQAFSVGGVPVVLPSASVTVAETRGELFAKSTWRLHDDLTLEGGLRLESSTISQSGDADQSKSFFYAKPRVQVTWTPWEGHQFQARFERELGQLDFGDFAASAELANDSVLGGNAELEPEQRWISELIYERRFLTKGVLSVGYRHDRIVDVIDVLPLAGGLSAVGNIGDGTLDQLTINLDLPLDWTGFSGGVFTFKNTWNQTQVTDPTTGRDRPISDVRPTQAVVALSQDITSWKINWSVAWIPLLGATTYDPDQTYGFRGRDYYQVQFGYKPRTDLSVDLSLTLWDDMQAFRTVYADRTLTRPIAYRELRQIDPRTLLRITLRKTF